MVQQTLRLCASVRDKNRSRLRATDYVELCFEHRYKVHTHDGWVFEITIFLTKLLKVPIVYRRINVAKRVMMNKDPIVEEVRRIRKPIESELNNDWKALESHFIRAQQSHKDRLVTGKPKQLPERGVA